MAGSSLSKRLVVGSTVLGAGAMLGIAGCPDPKGKYEAFVDETKDMRVIPEGPPAGSGIKDVTGEFALFISTPISPDQPLVFLATATMELGSDGGVLDLSVQPVVGDPKPLAECPEPGTPVGAPLVLEDVAVDLDGNFTADFGEREVEGCGNSLSGSDITATLKLIGTTLTEDKFCGIMEGAATKPFPLPLDGSKWGAVRVEPGAAMPAPDVECDAGGGGAGGAGGTGGAGGAGGTGGAGGG